MQNENLNKMHWKDKLEDAGNLPGETMQNKTAVWKKLHSRLHQKPHRRRVVWLWSVAASLFLAIIIPLFYMHKNASDSVIFTTKKSAATKPFFKEPKTEKTVAAFAPAQTKNLKNGNILIGKDIANKTIIATKNDVAINNDNEFIKDESITPLPAADSAVTPVIALAKTTKKLRVIHINELGDVVNEPPEMARASEQHIFQLKLAKEEIFTNISAAASNTSLPFLKSKTSPSN